MKKLLLSVVVAVAFLLIGFNTATAGQNLIQNGNFTYGLTPWLFYTKWTGNSKPVYR